jgi:hypothetical protein
MILFNLAVLTIFGQAPAASDPPVSGSVVRLRTVRQLATGQTVRSIDIDLLWKSHIEPVLVSSQPGRFSLQAVGREPVTVAAGASLGTTDSPLRHGWTVAVPPGWSLPDKPWACRVEGESIVARGKTTFTVGRLGDLLERARTGPVEVAREGAFRCLVQKIDKRAQRISVRLRVEIDAGGVALESYQSWAVLNSFEVLANNRIRSPLGFAVESQGASFVEVTYHLPGSLPLDALMSYRSITGLRAAPIRLDFKDIPPW